MAKPVVPSIGVVAERWSRRASAASPDYKSGVETTSKDWAQAATAAEGSYKTGVTTAANAGRYGRGVSKAGTQKWKRRASSVGPERYASGVQVATPEYQGGFAPFLDAIGSVDLPARGPRGAAGNYARVAPIGQALNQLKQRS